MVQSNYFTKMFDMQILSILLISLDNTYLSLFSFCLMHRLCKMPKATNYRCL